MELLNNKITTPKVQNNNSHPTETSSIGPDGMSSISDTYIMHDVNDHIIINQRSG